MNPNQSTRADNTPELNERLWQAWVRKNHNLDKAAAASRLKGLKFLLGMGVVAVLFQNFIR